MNGEIQVHEVTVEPLGEGEALVTVNFDFPDQVALERLVFTLYVYPAGGRLTP